MSEAEEKVYLDAAEQFLLGLFRSVRAERLREVIGPSISNAQAAAIRDVLQMTSSFLTTRSLPRQEALLADQKALLDSMKKQSDVMTKHSRAMLGLTIMLVFLTIGIGLLTYLLYTKQL